MYKIYERIVEPENVDLTNKIKNGPVELGNQDKKTLKGFLTGYCHKVVKNEKGEVVEFRLLIPEFDMCGKMKEYYIPEWRIQNTFGLAEDVCGRYVVIDPQGQKDLKVVKVI